MLVGRVDGNVLIYDTRTDGTTLKFKEKWKNVYQNQGDDDTFEEEGEGVRESGEVICVEWNRELEWCFASGGTDGIISIWDVRQTSLPMTQVQIHSAPITALSFSLSHPEIIYSASIDRSIRSYSLTKNLQLSVLRNVSNTTIPRSNFFLKKKEKEKEKTN